MTQTQSQDETERRLLSGMADLLRENSKERRDQLAELIGTQRAIDQRVSHLAVEFERMRLMMAGNLERLSDRMHERAGLSEQRYTEYSMSMQDVMARIGVLEVELEAIKLLVSELAINHPEEPDGSD